MRTAVKARTSAAQATEGGYAAMRGAPSRPSARAGTTTSALLSRHAAGPLQHQLLAASIAGKQRGDAVRARVVAEHVASFNGRRRSPSSPEHGDLGALEEAATHALVSFVRSRGLDLPLAPGAVEQLHTETYALECEADGGVRGTLLVAGAQVAGPDGQPTAVLALAARLSDRSGDVQHAQLRAHWACSKGLGRGWKAPPPGWHTQPSQSHDAGGGAWQTLMDAVDGLEHGGGNGGGSVRSMVLQVPLTGPLSAASSGVAMVFNMDRGQWFKAVSDAGHLTDVFFPTSNLASLLDDDRSRTPSRPATTTKRRSSDRAPAVWAPLADPPPPPQRRQDPEPAAEAGYSPFADLAPPPPAPAAPAAGAGASVAGSSWDSWDAGYGEPGVDDSVWEQRLREMRASIVPDSDVARRQGGRSDEEEEDRERRRGERDAARAQKERQRREEEEQEERRRRQQRKEEEEGARRKAAAQEARRRKRSATPQVAQLGVSDTSSLERFIAGFRFSHRSPGEFTVGGDVWQSSHVCGWMVDNVGNREPGAQRSLMHRFNEASELVDNVSGVGDWGEKQAALCGVAVWLRLSAMRLLPWNRNYNIKPREISAAQDRLCSRLSELWAASGRGQAPELRPLVRLALTSVGRGGQGDVGQRVRDEILEVQQRNHCKGGMMEEWHQKLHNNTSPDDVVICEALLAYCRKGLDISAYWDTLHQSNINAERLASFDRPIKSEPRFNADQVPGLIQDLTTYLHTLRAVHCGTDLASAAGNVLGFRSRDLKGSKEIAVDPVPQVASAELRTLLAAALHLQHVLGAEGTNAADGQDEPEALHGTVRLMELLVEARHVIRHAVLGGDSVCGGRHRDVIFLDVALESALRSALEASLAGLRAAAAAAANSPPSASDPDYRDARDGGGAGGNGSGQQREERAVGLVLDELEEGAEQLLPALSRLALRVPGEAKPQRGGGGSGGGATASQRVSLLLAATCLALESAALSSYPNEDLTAAMKWLNALLGMKAGELQRDRAMQALSVFDRLKRTLDNQSSALSAQLQPTAEAMGHRLGLPHHAIAIFSEEAIRGTAAAPLAQLLGVLEPCLRRLVGSGDWQVVSRGEAERSGGVQGVLRHHATLEEVQYHTYHEPTVLVVDNIGGHEEVPAGCVAVLSAHGQCPDMLAHSAVRARNMDVLLAACHNGQVAEGIKHMAGGQVRVVLSGQEVQVARA